MADVTVASLEEMEPIHEGSRERTDSLLSAPTPRTTLVVRTAVTASWSLRSSGMRLPASPDPRTGRIYSRGSRCQAESGLMASGSNCGGNEGRQPCDVCAGRLVETAW